MLEEAMRAELARLALDEDTRLQGIRRGAGARWAPTEVINPDTGVGFTDIQAWEFIARCLRDKNVQVETKALDHPPGAIAWVMKVPINGYEKRLYVKVELFRNTDGSCAYGRSFHIEDPR